MGRGPVASRVPGAVAPVRRWCAVLLAGVVLTGCGLAPRPGGALPPANQAAGTPEDAGTSGAAGSPPPAPETSSPAPVAPAPVPVPAPTSESELIEARIAELVNQARAEAGLAPLVVSAELTQASRAWTEQMAANFGLVHDPGLAVPPGARIAGENVAYRTTDPDVGANLHAQFMASQGHRENVLEPAYTTMGIGVVQSGDRTWVTERFVG